MTWTGETGGAIHLTNMGPRALLVLPAMEVAARTTSASKVHVKKIEKDRRKIWGKNFLYPVFVVFLEDDSSNPPREETEENNFIEPEAPRSPPKPWARTSKPESPRFPTPAPAKPLTEAEDLQKNEVVNTQQMCKLPFYCLFCIWFHLKMGGAGSVLGLGARKLRNIGRDWKEKKKLRTKARRSVNVTLLSVEYSKMDCRSKKIGLNGYIYILQFIVNCLMCCDLYLSSLWLTLAAS